MDIVAKIKSMPCKISYDSNRQYRDHIRTIFGISSESRSPYSGMKQNEIQWAEIDDESFDEMNFDEIQMEAGMHNLFSLTVGEPLFETLYSHAAGRMFSLDLTIGQAVLCAYDTFHWYYTCLWYFLNGKVIEMASCEEYLKLKKWFML